jgi:glycosyltransferase involved in cell wall biosynthesis
VVTADTPAVREVLRDGHDALLVPPADPAALAAALIRLADDPALRARRGSAARATFVARGAPRAAASARRDALAPLTFRA